MQNDDNRKMLLVFNHTFTENQRHDAKINLGVENFIAMPGSVQKIWSQIPADAEKIKPILLPIQNWLASASQIGDFVLIQGDFGATCLMVQFSFSKRLVPVYSATIRKAEEFCDPDGAIQTTHIFKHRRFRMYGR
jgi:hypothetical protein